MDFWSMAAEVCGAFDHGNDLSEPTVLLASSKLPKPCSGRLRSVSLRNDRLGAVYLNNQTQGAWGKLRAYNMRRDDELC